MLAVPHGDSRNITETGCQHLRFLSRLPRETRPNLETLHPARAAALGGLGDLLAQVLRAGVRSRTTPNDLCEALRCGGSVPS